MSRGGAFVLGEWVQASLRKQGWELGLKTHGDSFWVVGRETTT